MFDILMISIFAQNLILTAINSMQHILHRNIMYFIITDVMEYQTKTLSQTFGCCCGCTNLEGHCRHLLRVAKPHHRHVLFKYLEIQFAGQNNVFS